MSFFSSLYSRLRCSYFRLFFLTEGCCGIEASLLRTSIYDLRRLGIDIVDNCEQANVLLVSGWLNDKMIESVRETYKKMAKPTFVIAVGACAVSGSPFSQEGKKLLQDILPVDAFVPGCPPPLENYISAVLNIREKMQPVQNTNELLRSAIRSDKIQV